jgi:hypothetical protein
MRTKIISLLSCLSLFISSVPVYAAVFSIRSGDVTGLIAAINAANANGEENTINLETGTYTLRSIDNTSFQANGLPVISGRMAIRGESAETTIIERDTAAPEFRILDVRGTLVIDGITIRGGSSISPACNGGGIHNRGTLAIHRSTIEHNSCPGVGGGISNSGTLEMSTTHVRNNSAFSGAGIRNAGKANIVDSNIAVNQGTDSAGFENAASGTATIRNSTIQRNTVAGRYAGIYNEGAMTISNTTIANNRDILGGSDGVAIFGAQGTVDVINSTISGNGTIGRGELTVAGAGITMQNTIVAQNTVSFAPVPVPPSELLRDCPITSLGHNLFGNPTGCSTALHPTDLTGDPGLGTFIDSGGPGTGRFPLLPSSQAIDAGNEAACAATDQLDTPRRGRCDIGAVEFYPIINDLVTAGSVSTEFDALPVPGGPAGTFRIPPSSPTLAIRRLPIPSWKWLTLAEEICCSMPMVAPVGSVLGSDQPT